MAFNKYSIDTRAKDFYDIYRLMKYDLKKEELYLSSNLFNKCQRKNYYAKDIDYEEFTSPVHEVIDIIKNYNK